MKHSFTGKILGILKNNHGKAATDIFEMSPLMQYLNIKTKSADRGSKARGSFANLYAVYVLVEDYIANDFHIKGDYKKYSGAKFSNLFKRQRELPFGSKLQNHALNHRMNQEFKKYFPTCTNIPIIRDAESNRYWFNQNLLCFKVHRKPVNISTDIIEIINEYIAAKRSSFEIFINTCKDLQTIAAKDTKTIEDFIIKLISPTSDARIFEIVSYAILKYYYFDQEVYFGFDIEQIEKKNLKLFKTGRTNANDGGIDFVMRPLGRFFQVTETLDVKKYFLDIDKIEKYPITFVIKSTESDVELKEKLKEQAQEQYPVDAVIEKYMGCIEEIINIPALIQRFRESVENGFLKETLNEIIVQSKVEFNYEDPDENGDDD